MKNKKLIVGLCATAMLVPFALGLSACSKDNKIDINAKEVYAVSAISSVNYLSSYETKKSTLSSNELLATAESRPTNLQDSNIQGIKNCLNLFDEVIQSGEINETTVKNTESAENISEYNFVMTITLPGTNEVAKMYYNELETKTEKKIEDEKEESEVSTTLEGIMFFGENEFDVTGQREFETEGDETESTIEFTTKSKTNSGNYVKIKQSVEKENNEYEIEYEYKIYIDGKLVQETETEIENENEKIEVEFQLKNNGTKEKTIYKLKKGDAKNAFIVEYKINDTKDTINVEKLENGYKFAYSNGFVEVV